MADNIGLHIAHCCKWHGCKYGDEDCPVVLGQVEQCYLCETCQWELEDEEWHRNVIKRIEKMKAFKEKLKRKGGMICQNILI